MTPEKNARLIELQQVPWQELGAARIAELDALRRELAASPEVADDPATLFVDESRRPNLDGTDWNDANHAACRAEVEALALKWGAELLKVVVPLVLKG